MITLYVFLRRVMHVANNRVSTKKGYKTKSAFPSAGAWAHGRRHGQDATRRPPVYSFCKPFLFLPY